jgi:hypothetical protein
MPARRAVTRWPGLPDARRSESGGCAFRLDGARPGRPLVPAGFIHAFQSLGKESAWR